MNDVIADAMTLVRQASATIEIYYDEIEHFLDEKYGAGWSKSHSETVSQLVNACTKDYDSASTLSGLQDIRDKLGSIADAINGIEFPSE